MTKLSVVLATFNEEENIGACLASVKDIAAEIIIVDGSSTDTTVVIAHQYGAKVVITENRKIFHINKQMAIDAASYKWILQLDADERVTKDLANEIVHVISLSDDQIDVYQTKLKNKSLFLRHQQILEQRDGAIGVKEGRYTAFFIPRRNYFLGKYLKFGGVYPDGVIRLIRKGYAHLPAKDVHEQMVVDGRVGWLDHDLLHLDSPTFQRYLQRNNRYTDLMAQELQHDHAGKGPSAFVDYLFIKPVAWFFLTLVRHKGILDGWQGIVFSFFSSLRFPIAYIKYLRGVSK